MSHSPSPEDILARVLPEREAAEAKRREEDRVAGRFRLLSDRRWHALSLLQRFIDRDYAPKRRQSDEATSLYLDRRLALRIVHVGAACKKLWQACDMNPTDEVQGENESEQFVLGLFRLGVQGDREQIAALAGRAMQQPSFANDLLDCLESNDLWYQITGFRSHGLPSEEYPLIGEKAGGLRRYRGPKGDIRGQALHNLGFPPDWWIEPEVAEGWRSWQIPLQPTVESVGQWRAFVQLMIRYHLGPLNSKEGAADLRERLESDLRLIREHKPQLVADLPDPAGEPLAPEGGDCGRPAESDPAPKTLLTGWRAIAAALDMKYAQRDGVKSLNQRFNGPIVNKGAGTRPMVKKDDLIAWWNRLTILHQGQANQREGAGLSAESQYAYGRNGTAAPEVGGGVKKRRQDKRT